MSGKRRLSLEDQGSAKRRNQGFDSQAAFEVAQQMFRRAGEQQLHITFGSLLRARAPSEQLEAAYSPFFKELALAIVGRNDIPVPPAIEYAVHFRLPCDPAQEDMSGTSIERIIHYITVEDKKRPREVYAPTLEISNAVRDAWQTNYVGNSHDLLREAMNDMYIKFSIEPYGNFCSIIQGSGTGKSRLVDELSRSVFVISINLRPVDDKSSFPPGDVANKSSLVDFFCGFKFKPALYVQRRYLLFLLKAISFANELIDLQIASGCGTELLAAKWWDHIGLSQSKERIVMYTTAIDVSLPLKGLENILDESIQFDTIQIQVREFVNSVSKKINM